MCADHHHGHGHGHGRQCQCQCGTVSDAGGGTRTVIAVGTPAGRVGCTEAINVATQYVRSVSDTDVATIDGWSCNAQLDAQVPSLCAKGGLLINLLAQ